MSTETKPKAIKKKAGTGKGICHLAADPWDFEYPKPSVCGKMISDTKKPDGHGAHCNVCVVCADLAEHPHPGYAA